MELETWNQLVLKNTFEMKTTSMFRAVYSSVVSYQYKDIFL